MGKKYYHPNLLKMVFFVIVIPHFTTLSGAHVGSLPAKF